MALAAALVDSDNFLLQTHCSLGQSHGYIKFSCIDTIGTHYALAPIGVTQ